MQAGLFVLLVLTVVFAAGILYLKYNLEQLRAAVQNQAEVLAGVKLQMGEVKVKGLRGLRITRLHAGIAPENGPQIQMETPEALLYIDVLDLFYRRITIERLEVNKATFTVRRPPHGKWISAGWAQSLAAPGGAPDFLSFRVVGEGCTVNMQNILEEGNISVRPLDFDLFRPEDSPDTHLRVAACLEGAPERRLETTIRFRSLKDFDVRALCAKLAIADVHSVLPATRNLVQSGEAAPDLRVWGGPLNTLVLGLDMPFQDLHFVSKPATLLPNTGVLSALASYSIEEQVLTVQTAKATAKDFEGRVEGNVSFREEIPALDLKLRAAQLPISRIIDEILHIRSETYGDFKISFKDPFEVGLGLKGPVNALSVTAQAGVTAGNLRFAPKDPRWPAADLEFGQVQVAWNQGNTVPEGSLSITGGTFTHPPTGLSGEKVSGTLTLRTGEMVADPLTMFLREQQVTGRLKYALDKKAADFSVSGTIAKIEDFPWATLLPYCAFHGTIQAQCEGQTTPEHWRIGGGVDLTQTQVSYRWWLDKAAGIGASFRDVKLDVDPKKSLALSGILQVDTTPVQIKMSQTWKGGKWRLASLRFETDALDVATAAKCLRTPYTITGGKGTQGYFEWQPPVSPEAGPKYELGGQFDTLSLIPAGNPIPIALQGVEVKTVFDNTNPNQCTGELQLKAASASIPPLGSSWLLPLRPDNPAILEAFPEKERDWRYPLSAGQLEMPPWKGTQFAGVAYSRGTETGLEHFEAVIDSGRIEGSFKRNKLNNEYTLDTTWTTIPAVYLIRHMKFPELLNGTTNGHIAYSADQDDPSTLKGAGNFEILDGQFSADFLVAKFQEQLNGELATLPPSLRISKLTAEVQLEGDIIRTPKISLEGQGITVSGGGQYVLEGDMDYTLKISITPETAERMPMVKEKLSVAGYKITQNNIEFSIRVQGPTFRPSSQVVGLPSVGVTLISGAAEVTGEAIKVIDTPRQILIDVLKIFGGIVGPGGK